MPWIFLTFAGLLEIVWAVALKHSNGFTRLTPSLVMLAAMAGSLALLALAMRSLPLGTAYMIWTGIGAVGAFICGVLLFGEAVTGLRIAAAALIVAGMIMMKIA